MKEDNNLPQQSAVDRNKTLGLLKKLGITAACLVPVMAYSTLRGYYESQGIFPLGSQGADKTLTYITAIPAIGVIGQIIPFRFDNMDPGCLSTIVAIPLGIGLANACYAFGASLGSMNK